MLLGRQNLSLGYNKWIFFVTSRGKQASYTMMSCLTDQDILVKVRAGDTASFSLLVDRYKSMVFTVAMKMIKQRE
ncbi:MAG: hypothetical protein WBN59_03855, partial [Flavobacteriaceae bacterium]